MNEITNLKTKHFQHKLGSFGDVVTDLDDIGQCYQTILETIKGDVPLMPNLGTNIIETIGEDHEHAAKIAKAIAMQELPKQEPRGKVLDVEVSYTSESRLSLKIKYKSIFNDEIAEKEVIL